MKRYQREAAILKNNSPDIVRKLMKEYGAFIAGGAITSVFSSSAIRDYDIFFRDPVKLEEALKIVTADIETDAAVSFTVDKHRVQLIRVLTGEPNEVISTFDFTICQGAFDGEDFYLSGSFFQHLAQRKLVFNIKAEYPLCSLYRARKFITRGFSLSGIEAIKLGLKLNSIQIKTYADLRKQLMGIDTLFLADLTDSLDDSTRTYDFTEFATALEEYAINKLDSLTGSEE